MTKNVVIKDKISDFIEFVKKEVNKEEDIKTKELLTFLENNPDFLPIYLSDDEERFNKIIGIIGNYAKKINDKECTRHLDIFKNAFDKISINYHGNKKELWSILSDFELETIKSAVKTLKEKAPKERNKIERKFIIDKFNLVCSLTDYDGCEFRGKFSKNKFTEKYTNIVNKKYGKRFNEKTIRTWITNYIKTQ